MAKSRYIKEENLSLVVATYDGQTIDVSAHNGAFIQVSGDAAGTGTLKVQQSNDGISWVDHGTAAIASGKAVYNAANLYAQLIRSQIVLSAGPGVYNIYTMAKDQG